MRGVGQGGVKNDAKTATQTCNGYGRTTDADTFRKDCTITYNGTALESVQGICSWCKEQIDTNDKSTSAQDVRSNRVGAGAAGYMLGRRRQEGGAASSS